MALQLSDLLHKVKLFHSECFTEVFVRIITCKDGSKSRHTWKKTCNLVYCMSITNPVCRVRAAMQWIGRPLP